MPPVLSIQAENMAGVLLRVEHQVARVCLQRDPVTRDLVTRGHSLDSLHLAPLQQESQPRHVVPGCNGEHAEHVTEPARDQSDLMLRTVRTPCADSWSTPEDRFGFLVEFYPILI